jgi:protein-L-isoaspartate(D-aspartate) O-methyltransferase
LELLQDYLVEGSKCLDVGSGSGILLELMSNMVGKEGKVYGIEYIQEIYEMGNENLKKSNNLLKNIEIKNDDGWCGWEEYSPFSAIHVGAGNIFFNFIN